MPHQFSIDLLFTQLLKPKLQRPRKLLKPKPSALQHTTRLHCPTDHQLQLQFDQSMQLHLKLKLLRH
jgi:hypothetical protein